MRAPDHASAPPGTGPLTARLVVRHAWAMTRGRRGRIAAAAAAFFVPAALVWFAAEEFRPTPDEALPVRVALAALDELRGAHALLDVPDADGGVEQHDGGDAAVRVEGHVLDA